MVGPTWAPRVILNPLLSPHLHSLHLSPCILTPLFFPLPSPATLGSTEARCAEARRIEATGPGWTVSSAVTAPGARPLLPLRWRGRQREEIAERAPRTTGCRPSRHPPPPPHAPPLPLLHWLHLPRRRRRHDAMDNTLCTSGYLHWSSCRRVCFLIRHCHICCCFLLGDSTTVIGL